MNYLLISSNFYSPGNILPFKIIQPFFFAPSLTREKGDTILIRGGTYREQVEIPKNILTITSYNKEKVIRGSYYSLYSIHYKTFNNLVIVNADLYRVRHIFFL